ncbi:MAG: aminotransferase class V-fold PLP-dependent enzyme [Oscillospiraceae bacterium]|nr:aminotransferase class V-fold PLP-dependent enzyme [Oscillospiraceae bacterium]
MNIYDKLGVKQFINASATLTMYGGSIMPDEVVRAMKEAAGSYVDILELHKKAGDYIAKLTRNEGAFISNGAAAGLVLAAAAAVAGDDPARREMLPLSDGKNEIVISKAGRIRYDFALKMGGAKYALYGDDDKSTEAQLEAAITPNTAAIFMFYFEHRMGNQPSFEAQARIAKERGVYLFVDAAAQLPAKENLWKFTQGGADLAIFSGGKGLRGPQSSGLIVGKRELIDRIATIASPNGGIGRPFKVGKEEIVGLMTAVRLYVEADEVATVADYERQVEYFIGAFGGSGGGVGSGGVGSGSFGGVEVTRSFPSEAGQPMPRAQVRLLPGAFKADAAGVAAQLKECKPAVLVAVQGDSLMINPQTLFKGEIEIVADKIKEVLIANAT